MQILPLGLFSEVVSTSSSFIKPQPPTSNSGETTDTDEVFVGSPSRSSPLSVYESFLVRIDHNENVEV
ncbi:hypothetical protein PC123_g21828 [Phytophthora cactorum]|nr:hypothetical protein PC120_g20512 [Phytophthora cactorum]KAG4042685.1 hypothetical protein PC123_g21828 [Phytophthora cactorum]